MKCPECDYEAGSRRGLGVHRRFKHGVIGDRKSYRRKVRQPTSTTPVCPECGWAAANNRGLGVHRRVEHGVVSEANERYRRQKKKPRKLKKKPRALMIMPPGKIPAPMPVPVGRLANYCPACGTNMRIVEAALTR